MCVSEVKFLRQSMVAEHFIQSREATSLISFAVLVDGLFLCLQRRWKIGRILKVGLSRLSNSLSSSKEEKAVFNERAGESRTGIPAQEKWNFYVWHIGRVYFIVAVKQRRGTVPVICSAFRHNIDDAP